MLKYVCNCASCAGSMAAAALISGITARATTISARKPSPIDWHLQTTGIGT